MSKTASEFVEGVLAALPPEALRKTAADDEGDAFALACIIVDRVVGQLHETADEVAVLEMVKFKRMMVEFPEQFWPKPDIQKGGDA